jgi:hypothetical protein
MHGFRTLSVCYYVVLCRLSAVRMLCVVVSNDATANTALEPCNADRSVFLKKALVPQLIEDADYRSERPKKLKSLDVKDVSAVVVCIAVFHNSLISGSSWPTSSIWLARVSRSEISAPTQ